LVDRRGFRGRFHRQASDARPKPARNGGRDRARDRRRSYRWPCRHIVGRYRERVRFRQSAAGDFRVVDSAVLLSRVRTALGSVADLRRITYDPTRRDSQVLTLGTLDLQGIESSMTILVRTDQVEIVELTIPAGTGIPRYEAQGELILHCLEGDVTVRAGGERHDLLAGQLLYLLLGDPFSVYAAEDSRVLATIVAAKEGPRVELIGK